MSIRAIVYGLLVAEFNADMPNRIFGPAAADETISEPFCTYRIRGTFPSGASRSGLRGLEVWFHDRGGSYLRIDGFITRAKNVLDNVVNVQGEGGSLLSQCRWESDSPDLTDDGHRTITRMTSYTLVGRDA